jgi:hypothetical protein
MFFFEKKNQKTFVFCSASHGDSRQRKKVFCFFFSKKKCLPSRPGTSRGEACRRSTGEHSLTPRAPEQCGDRAAGPPAVRTSPPGALRHRDGSWIKGVLEPAPAFAPAAGPRPDSIRASKEQCRNTAQGILASLATRSPLHGRPVNMPPQAHRPVALDAGWQRPATHAAIQQINVAPSYRGLANHGPGAYKVT